VVFLRPAVDGVGVRVDHDRVDRSARSANTLTSAGGSSMADIDHDRLRRDAAGVGPYARDAERLVPLKDMGSWDVAEGEPDIRGWEVRTVGGRELGKVKELLVDPDAGEVVMLDVDLAGSDQHALVPLRIVEIDRARRVVRMDSADLTPSERAAVEKSDERDHPVERVEQRERHWADTGRVRYPTRGDEEVVVERRPIVEEVVVRRHVVDDENASPESLRRRAEDAEKRD
jgi:sporulation protein YlmC with PRC-barrel domain